MWDEADNDDVDDDDDASGFCSGGLNESLNACHFEIGVVITSGDILVDDSGLF